MSVQSVSFNTTGCSTIKATSVLVEPPRKQTIWKSSGAVGNKLRLSVIAFAAPGQW